MHFSRLVVMLVGLGTSAATPCWAQCEPLADAPAPLTEMGCALYRGEPGGLYPGGLDRPPAEHDRAGREIAASLVPIRGRVVVLAMGMSNTSLEATAAVRALAADRGAARAELLLVDGAWGGHAIDCWGVARGEVPIARCSVDPVTGSNNPWDRIDRLLADRGLAADQVQVAWVKHAFSGPASRGEFPGHTDALTAALVDLLRAARERFPALRIVHLSTRTHAYTTSSLSPEPYAFENGFAVRDLIGLQLAGDPRLDFGGDGTGPAPWLGWGPYLWAQGTRADGFTWPPSAVRTDDCTHPSAEGSAIVADALLDFFARDPVASQWFRADPAAIGPAVATASCPADAGAVADDAGSRVAADTDPRGLDAGVRSGDDAAIDPTPGDATIDRPTDAGGSSDAHAGPPTPGAACGCRVGDARGTPSWLGLALGFALFVFRKDRPPASIARRAALAAWLGVMLSIGACGEAVGSSDASPLDMGAIDGGAPDDPNLDVAPMDAGTPGADDAATVRLDAAIDVDRDAGLADAGAVLDAVAPDSGARRERDCADRLDEDGDGLTDCSDRADCADVCAQACALAGTASEAWALVATLGGGAHAVGDLAVAPDGTLFATVNREGVYRSRPPCYETWELVHDDALALWRVVLVSPRGTIFASSAHVTAGSGDHVAIVRSRDGGESFEDILPLFVPPTGAPPVSYYSGAVTPDTGVVLLGTGWRSGESIVWRSTDDGASFTALAPTLRTDRTIAVGLTALGAGEVWVGTEGDGAWGSRDDGASLPDAIFPPGATMDTWHQARTVRRLSDRRLLVSLDNRFDGAGGLWRGGTDPSAPFAPLPRPPGLGPRAGTGWSAQVLDHHALGDTLLVSTVQPGSMPPPSALARSDDGGDTWSDFSSGAPAGTLVYTFAESDDGFVYAAGTGGAVLRTRLPLP